MKKTTRIALKIVSYDSEIDAAIDDDDGVVIAVASDWWYFYGKEKWLTKVNVKRLRDQCARSRTENMVTAMALQHFLSLFIWLVEALHNQRHSNA